MSAVSATISVAPWVLSTGVVLHSTKPIVEISLKLCLYLNVQYANTMDIRLKRYSSCHWHTVRHSFCCYATIEHSQSNSSTEMPTRCTSIFFQSSSRNIDVDLYLHCLGNLCSGERVTLVAELCSCWRGTTSLVALREVLQGWKVSARTLRVLRNTAQS